MAYTFQYVPTSGDLSGVSFESQTAIAINELGTRTDETGRSVGQALDVAQNAQTTANDALLTAQNAEGSADNARLAADQALAAAGNAQTDAAAALERANNAYDTAEIAGTTAVSALARAQSVTETANNAQAEAATASQNAEQAMAIAQGALAAASIDNDLFTVDATFRDADEAYRGTEKSYLTNAGEEGPNVNFPNDLAFPAYFEVMKSNEGGAVMQRCWQDGGTRVFTRFASINDSDPGNPVVDGSESFRREGERTAGEGDEDVLTWGAWLSSAPGAAAVPVGFEADWPGVTAPSGWIDESIDNGPLLRSAFPDLWSFADTSGNIIDDAEWLSQKTTQGAVGAFSRGAGGTTFRIPLRKRTYTRSADLSDGLAVGQWQRDTMRPITGSVERVATDMPLGSGTGALRFGSVSNIGAGFGSGNYRLSVELDSSRLGPPYSGPETRPVTIVRLPIIKAFDAVVNAGNVDVAGLVTQLGMTNDRIAASQQVLHAYDEKPNGVNGGTASGQWMIRDLNTVANNTIPGASLANNQITLPAGTYEIRIDAPGYAVNAHVVALYNASTSEFAIRGQNNMSHYGYIGATVASAHGFVSISTASIFAVRHLFQSTTVSGLGYPSSSAAGSALPERYTNVVIRRIS